jgi:sugar lactone lactonase YvrE
LAVDATGNVYVADQQNNKVRMITRSTGFITTVAGMGPSGSTGDYGLATFAMLNYPYDVAVDSSGNIFIADTGNYKVRLVTKATGFITTYAGTGTFGSSSDYTMATNAQLMNPRGVAVDSSGNLYIADSGNYKVRLVTRNTGMITTFAGMGFQGTSGDSSPAIGAFLSYPSAVTLDSSDNVYIGDAYRVRLVTRSNGIITTIAGTGMYGSTGDGFFATSATFGYIYGVAVDASGNVYVADEFSYNVRLVTRSTGIITTFAGQGGQYGTTGDGGAATSALLLYPAGVAVDASGNVFISDAGSNKIREVAAADSAVRYCHLPFFANFLSHVTRLSCPRLASQPSVQSTALPTPLHTGPSSQPTQQPTADPTGQPTGQPVAHPTSQPTQQPTSRPTAESSPYLAARRQWASPGLYTWKVPHGVTSITVSMWGGGGGGGGTTAPSGQVPYAGGAGGFTACNVSVTPGQRLYVLVGGGGSSCFGTGGTPATGTACAGGFGGKLEPRTVSRADCQSHKSFIFSQAVGTVTTGTATLRLVVAADAAPCSWSAALTA